MIFLLENSLSYDKREKMLNNIKLVMDPLFGYI